MAFLIPENVRSNRSIDPATRRVATALVMLDDEVTVWYEPPFDPDGDRPDFVVLDPSLGAVVVAVFSGELLGAFGGSLRVKDGAGETEVADPVERANRFGLELRRRLATSPHLSAVPVSGVAAFPNLDRAEADHQGIDSVVRLDHCLFKEDLDAAIRSGDGGVVHRRLSMVLEGGLGETLGIADHDQLRGLIHPEVVIQGPIGQGSLFGALTEETDVVKVMDRRQEQLAKSLGGGHRVIRGVAGSGKTLVLVHRARQLARLMPSKRILVTCYTRALASQLREQLDEHDNVEVLNVDKLLVDAVRDAGEEPPKHRDGRMDWDALPKMALAALRRESGPRYRAVLVDEAQDFDTTKLKFCVGLLESDDPDDQDLVIVADSAQNIFRRNFRWKDAGIKAQGRTRILRVNYRNTREILEFAHGFLVADPNLVIDEAPEADDELSIIPAESAERSGPRPTVRIERDPDAEITAVIDCVKGWYRPRMRPRSIAVLMASQDAGERIVEGLDAANIPTFWVNDPSDQTKKDRAGSADEPVIVSTIHSAKGLEFPKVVVCRLSSVGQHSSDRVIEARKTAYVGFTRATDELTVVTTADNSFVRDLTAPRPKTAGPATYGEPPSAP